MSKKNNKIGSSTLEKNIINLPILKLIKSRRLDPNPYSRPKRTLGHSTFEISVSAIGIGENPVSCPSKVNIYSMVYVRANTCKHRQRMLTTPVAPGQLFETSFKVETTCVEGERQQATVKRQLAKSLPRPTKTMDKEDLIS